MTDPFRKKDKNVIPRSDILCYSCGKAKPPSAFESDVGRCRKCNKEVKRKIKYPLQ